MDSTARNSRVFSVKQISGRWIAARALPLCLTAGVSVVVDHYVRSGLRNSADESVAIETKALKLDSALIIKSIPDINFPESLSDLDNVDFWIFTTADLDSDGAVKNITVNFYSAVSFKEQSLWDNLLVRVNEKQRRLITRELAETLASQLAGINFEPKVSGGVAVVSPVVVSTHFRGYRYGPSKIYCHMEIKTQVESHDGPVLGGQHEEQSLKAAEY